MGLRSRKGSGFTLIELLVVIVIIMLLAALLLPALLKALCSARQGSAAHLISQIDQAVHSYETDYAVFPPGDGTGTKDVVSALSKPGPKKAKYFEFVPELLKTTNVINPTWPDGDPPIDIIYYRCNVKYAGSGAPPSGGGGGGGNQPSPMHQSGFDMWCAGCNYTSGVPTTGWDVNNW